MMWCAARPVCSAPVKIGWGGLAWDHESLVEPDRRCLRCHGSAVTKVS